MSILGKIANAISASMIGKKRYQRYWQSLYYLSLRGMNIGGGSEFSDSGEKEALLFLVKHVFTNSSPIIFDVGANIGGYTLDVLNIIKNPKIYCFEPARSTYELLKKNINSRGVVLNNFGISDKISNAVLYCSANSSGLSSLYHRQLDDFKTGVISEENIVLDTIDNYCAKENICFIDFLKMDIEGNELNALKGAQDMLRSRKIAALQIEFGGCNVDSRTYFRDYWNLLSEDFNVYRILKDGLYKIESYHETMELFHCTNYMFISKVILDKRK